MAWWQRRSWQLYGALTLAWSCLYFRLLIGKRVLPWDAKDEFYPMVFFNAHSLRHGLAPWWNPYIYSGYPQIADPQGLLFSPLLTGWMMLPSTPGQSWFAWGVLLHLLLGACAMLALLRRWAANDLGALLGALVYLAGGVAAARLEHVSIVIAYAWAPVAWLALERFLARPRLGRALAFGIAAGLMLTALVQFSYLMALMLAGFALTASIVRWPDYARGQRLWWFAGMLLAGATALLIGLPQLLLSAAFASLSNRAELPLDAATPASLGWRAFLTLFSPNALHALRGQYHGPASLVEAFFYIGALPLLMLLGLRSAWRDARHRWLLIFLGVAGVLAVLYGMGTHTPFYGWLYQWLPGVKQFRRPSDAAYLINLLLAAGVAVGTTHLRLDDPKLRARLLVVATLWLVLASLGMRGDGLRWQAVSLVAAAVCAIAWWRLRRPQLSPAHVTAWLLLLVVVDYRCFNLNGSFNEGGDPTKAFLRDDATVWLQQHVTDNAQLLPARVEPLTARAEWDNLVIRAGIYSTQGYNPLRYALYDTWYGARNSMSDPWPSRAFNDAPGGTLSALLGAQYIVRGAPTPGQDGLVMAAGMEKVLAGPLEVWRNPRAYPRVLTPVHMLVGDALPTPAQMNDTDFRDAFWLTPRDAADRTGAMAVATQCAARLQVTDARQTPTALTLQTSATDGAGWLVVSELDFPGWQARVDGQPIDIHRVNGMFRGVCVPAGTHQVSFQFHPWTMVAEAYRRHRAQAL